MGLRRLSEITGFWAKTNQRTGVELAILLHCNQYTGTYGVARFETSLVICIFSQYTSRLAVQVRYTYHIDAAVSSHRDDGVESTEIDTNNWEKLAESAQES